MTEYDVFIDESGLFTETSNDPGDRIIEHKRRKKFPSQLAGIIVTSDSLSPYDAWEVFAAACKEANATVGEDFHSTDIKKQGSGIFDSLVQATCRCLDQIQIQPFRIVNRERVSFGDRKANYINIVGELLVRICKELDLASDEALTLNIYQAGIKNSEYETGNMPFWEHDDFIPTLQTVFQRASISAGWATESAKWNLGTFEFRSGKKDERLWICDLVSNASHDDFNTIDDASASALKSSLGDYDFSLSFDTTLQQVRELSSRQAYGIALIQLIQGVLSPWVGAEAKAAYTGEFDRVTANMLSLPPLARTPQLQTVQGWLHQTADDRDRLIEAKSACKLVVERLVSKQQPAIDDHDSTLGPWLRLSISTAWLTACNHSGDLVGGREQSEMIESLIPMIAGRWEYASDLMRAMVVQSVHLNDCFEHKRVCEKMDLVSQYYETLGGMFRDAYKEVFPVTVRSKVCGEALGTKVQSEIFLLLSGDVTVDVVRETSEKAIEQFSDEHDRQWQYQFRSEIEAIAGQWQQSREYLAKGIGCAQCDHDSLGRYITSIPKGERSFPLLHWTRIGGMAAVAHNQAELDAFAAAWRASELHSFIQREMSRYPAHGILRRMASFYATVRDDAKVVETLRSLRSVVKTNPTTLFGLIEVAAVLQASGIAGRRDPGLMSRLLGGSKSDPEISELIKKVAKDAASSQPRISALASQWTELLSGTPTADQLVDAASVVAY